MNYKQVYQDPWKQFAFENACDCLYFGMSRDDWNDCGVSIVDHVFIWRRACDYMENGGV